jgi:hypothetical protein
MSRQPCAAPENRGKVVLVGIPIRAFLLLTLVPMFAACGGKVVVDAPSDPVLAACAAFCNARTAAGCPSQDQEGCAASCAIEVGYDGVCASTAVTVLECSANLSPGELCAATGCEEEQAQRDTCTHPPGGCTANHCSTNPDDLHCTMICSENVYETSCIRSAQAFSCACILNGSTVGACTDVTVGTADCCLGIFASL